MKKEDILKSVRAIVYAVNQMPTKEKEEVVFQIEEELKDMWLNDDDKVDGLVFKTNILTQFKDVIGNRIINDNSVYVRKLADSIQRIGNVTPIIINENKEVIDGQRRIAAVRKYGLPNPIRYVRHLGATIDTVGDINHLQIKWNHKDWLHKYSSLDRKDYKDYLDIAEKYEAYMKSRSLRGLLMNGRVDPLKSDVWEEGQFNIDRSQYRTVIDYLEFLKKVYLVGDKDNIFAKDRNFQKALFDIFKKTKSLDEDRLLYKIRYGFNRLNIRTDYKSYKKILGSLYNSKLSGDKNHVVSEESVLVPVE